MCSGGFFRDSIILVSGATGTGKTLMVTEFMAGGVNHGERCLLFAFEESREQLVRNANGWGIDYEKMEQEGHLKILARYPESAGLEDHLIWMKKEMDAFVPGCIYVEIFGEMRRCLTVLKMRGSIHDKDIREYIIDGNGYHIGKPFTNVSGILSGNIMHVTQEEIDRMSGLFQEPGA